VRPTGAGENRGWSLFGLEKLLGQRFGVLWSHGAEEEIRGVFADLFKALE
jgi:hypothetical protein